MVDLSILQTAPPYLVALIMFVLVVASYVLGHRLRGQAIENNPDEKESGTTGWILLGLLGLLLAFAFSMANSRFDSRRDLVIQEANAIGTVILRTDVLPDSVQILLRNNLRQYVEERIAFYQVGMNVEKAIEHYRNADQIAKKVWSITVAYAKKDPGRTVASQLIPALNEMIDITTTRRATGEATIPDSILYVLFMLCITNAFLLGYENKSKIDWIIVGGFSIMLSITLFSIIDLDRPRSGLVNMDVPNQKIIELREMFAE